MKLRALIVGDDGDAGELLVSAEKCCECLVERCATVEEAVQRVQVEPPDVVLTPAAAEKVNGYELCERLRSEPGTGLLPVIMLRRASDATGPGDGFRVGANVYLDEPCTPERLADAVRIGREWKRQAEQDGVKGEIAFELPSDVSDLTEVIDLICSRLLLTPMGERRVSQFRRAVLEMGLNAIEWGNLNDPAKTVYVTYRLLGDRVEVTVKDEGQGFDPDNLPHAATEKDPLSHVAVRELLGLREGGYGILLARGLVDELRYSAKGNEVAVVKRFGLGTPNDAN